MPEYTPGEWVAVVTPGRLALLPGATPDAVVRRLWESLRAADGDPLVPHLAALAHDGLDAVPPFALAALAGGRLHVALRGAVEVEVRSAAGTRVLTAPHVSTWSEETVDGPASVTVRAPGGAGPGAPAPGAGLPLECGVVRAGAVRVLPAEAVVAAESAPAVPAPAESAPVPTGPTTGPTTGRPAPVLAPALVPVGDEPFDHTLLRPAAPVDPGPAVAAAVEPAPAVPAAADPAASTDHDGTTVLGGDVLALRRQLPEWTGHAVAGPLVVPAAPTPAPARIALSTGERVPLTRPVLIGRAPQASRVSSTQVPRLVTVPSPLGDISRTHAEVRMDGDDVVLTDLRSTNGVLVVRPAAAPQRLQPGEATVLQPGVLVDLGEDITFTVERSA